MDEGILNNPYAVLNNYVQQVRQFIPGSMLKAYLANKLPNHGIEQRTHFYLNEVLMLLKDIIGAEMLYDPDNTSMILCDWELDQALGQSALHLCQVR